jgi:hypothetical protein
MSLTPEQFSKIALKEDLKELEERLDAKIGKRIDQVLTSVDGLAKSVKDFKAEMASNQGAHDRMSNSIINHEVRIKKLELKNV